MLCLLVSLERLLELSLLDGKRSDWEKLKLEGLSWRASSLRYFALALYEMQRYEEAFEAFRKGEDEGTVYYNLGCLCTIERKHTEAIQSFEKAVELKPGFYIKAHESSKKARAAMTQSQHNEKQ